MSSTIVKTPRKPKVKFFEARYHRNGELDSFFFASDATRKPLTEEAQEAYAKMAGDEGSAPVEIEDVYQIGEIRDYTTNTSYKIILKKQ